MKKGLNAAIKGASLKIDEVFLFRTMANEFNNNTISKSTYVEEIHGTKGMVEFPSNFKIGGSAKAELGDLLIFTFDKSTKELRLCVMQAKYRRGGYYRFLNSKADLFQWELLHDKPSITNRSKFNFPTNILNFRMDYGSISAYGIFYHDNISNEIDFLYTLPYFFKPRSFPGQRVSNGSRSFKFRCPISIRNPDSRCILGITPREAISTCSIDVFEQQVLLCKVGAPIPIRTEIGKWVLVLLRNMRTNADDSNIIDEVLEFYNNDIPIEDINPFRESPSALIVVTDSERYREMYK